MGQQTDELIPESYLTAALARRRLERLEDGSWAATIPAFDGVRSDGDTREEADRELRSVLEGWLLLKPDDGDGDIPEIDGINLNRRD